MEKKIEENKMHIACIVCIYAMRLASKTYLKNKTWALYFKKNEMG